MSREQVSRYSFCSRRHADRHGRGPDGDSQASCWWPSPSIELVRKLLREPDVELLAACDLDEGRTTRLAPHGAGQRARPLPRAFGGHDSEVEQPIVGSRVGERGDVAHDLADVSDE